MRKLPAWGPIGVFLFAAGLWALAADLEGWNAVWYLPAWYGYLLVLDAVIFRLRGRSYLAGRRGELLTMLLVSAPFWFLFEAYNLRLQNWYYVFGLRTQWLSAIVSVLAFSTVLPACLFHAELVKALGVGQGARPRNALLRAGDSLAASGILEKPLVRRSSATPPRGFSALPLSLRPRRARDGHFSDGLRVARLRPIRVTGAVELFCIVMGVLSIAAPLLWPRYAFGLVWGALFWLPEVINRRAGAPSILADLEAGRAERLLQLLIGGLWAGAIWETFNFWARCKWIYTVPGFEDWKVFEMPLAGFLGFPVLALSAFACFSAVIHFLSGRRRALLRSVAIAGAVIFSGVTFHAMFDRTVQSRRPLLSELAGVDSQSIAALRKAGIPTPERLERAVRREGLASIARRTAVVPEDLSRAHQHAALALHKGMGADAAALLLRAGVATVADLSREDPEALSRRAAAAGEAPLRLSLVRVWVRAARLSGEPRR